MSRSSILLFLLTLSCFRAVADDSEPIVSGSQSATCPLPTELTTTNIGYANARLNWQGPCPVGSISGSSFGVNGYAALFQVYSSSNLYSIQWKEKKATQWETIDNNSWEEFKLTGLYTNTAYEIRMQTQCSATDRSEFSPPISFTTSCQPPYSIDLYDRGVLSIYAAYETGVIAEWREVGTTLWNQSPLLNEFNGANSAYYWFGAKPQTMYELRAKGVCADGSFSGYTPVRTTRMADCYLQPVTAVFTDCVGWESARISWSGCPTLHDGFMLQWRAKNTTCWNTLSVADSLQNPSYGSYHVYNGRYVLRALLPETEYEYRVGGAVQEGAAVVFAEPKSFTTTNASVKITSYTSCPATGADQVILYWYAQTCYGPANEYECQYRPLGSSVWQTTRFLQATYYQLMNLTPNTTYEYRVRLSIPGGYVGGFSPTYTITTGYGKIDSFYGLGQNGRECTDITIGFDDCLSVGATYQVRYRVRGSSGWLIGLVTDGTNKYTFANLLPLTSYEVQVRAQYADGTTTDYSSSGNITTGCSQIPYARPYDLCHYEATEKSARVQWKGSGPFELRWRKGYTTDWNSVIVGSMYTAFPVNYLLTNLDSNTPYEWQVRSLNAMPYYFTPVRYFRTICNAPVYVRAKVTTASSATLIWTRTDPNLTFTLQWRKKGETIWQQVENIARPDYVLDSLQRNIVYEWRVSTQCSATPGLAEGPIQTFRTLTYANQLFTVQHGNWTEPATWSCNRVPTAADAVQILHRVNLSANQTGNAAAVQYGISGNLTVEQKARLLLSF